MRFIDWPTVSTLCQRDTRKLIELLRRLEKGEVIGEEERADMCLCHRDATRDHVTADFDLFSEAVSRLDLDMKIHDEAGGWRVPVVVLQCSGFAHKWQSVTDVPLPDNPRGLGQRRFTRSRLERGDRLLKWGVEWVVVANIMVGHREKRAGVDFGALKEQTNLVVLAPPRALGLTKVLPAKTTRSEFSAKLGGLTLETEVLRALSESGVPGVLFKCAGRAHEAEVTGIPVYVDPDRPSRFKRSSLRAGDAITWNSCKWVVVANIFVHNGDRVPGMRDDEVGLDATMLVLAPPEAFRPEECQPVLST